MMPFTRRSPTTGRPPAAPGHGGFNAGGYLWSTPALLRANGAAAELELRRRRAAEDARLTRSLGGNLLRCFWSVEEILVGDPEAFTLALNSLARADLCSTGVFLRPLEERVSALDRCHVVLDDLLLAVEDDPRSQFRLDFGAMDAALAGLADANRESSERVQVLLCLVCPPPRWIIEAPSDETLSRLARPYNFATLWDRYVRFHAALHRRVLVRYAVQRPLTGLAAFEAANEPDYTWTPEEVKIEGGPEALVNPLGKYVTELQLMQIPTVPGQAYERAPWGFSPQDAAWGETERATVPVLSYDWGRKFDWYVMCAAQLQEHVARGIKQEAAEHGVAITTVSASVTHNNIDFLLRMHRLVERAFVDIDKIGLHPYHWVGHDVWDDQFLGATGIEGWPAADPRRYATSFTKRFDFLAAFRENSGVRSVDQEIRSAFGPRKLWLTEFGIGSKVLGSFNANVADNTRFIRPRGLVGGSGGYADVVWEDLWESFLEQVDARWLREHDVECLLLYGLRELGVAGSDLDDDDRSNLALFHADGTSRADLPVIEGVGGLLGDLTSRPTAVSGDGSRSPRPELHRRPWRSVELSPAARDVMTMLSVEERQLLHWSTASYRSGAGAIIDGGCFTGGSTVPLAEGLRASGGGVIDVYDRFEVEPYMTDFYFRGQGLAPGDSFRPLFDANTAHVSDLLRVHEGDLLAEGWSGDPVEILFIDFAKSWELNDLIVAQFFPALVPGRSIVVQQDFVCAACPWVAVTMELLSDYFEPVGFAEYCSVVYLCRRAIPAELPAVSALGEDRALELMDHAVARFRGYPRRVLECAKAALLLEHGDRRGALAILERSGHPGSEHHAVTAAVEYVSWLAA